MPAGMMKTTWDMKIRFFTIPNLLTLSNLLCGTFAALSALVYDNLEWAFWFVVLAAVFDFFDGFAARLLHQSSPIGVQLDSLADMISFGFVPAAVVYTMTTRSMGEGVTLLRYAFAFICFAMAAFSALRLAKFNIDETQHEEFCGLPTPANALFFTSLGLISAHTGFDFGGPVLICIVPAMAWLLISPVRMFSLKFRGFDAAERGGGAAQPGVAQAGIVVVELAAAVAAGEAPGEVVVEVLLVGDGALGNICILQCHLYLARMESDI